MLKASFMQQVTYGTRINCTYNYMLAILHPIYSLFPQLTSLCDLNLPSFDIKTTSLAKMYSGNPHTKFEIFAVVW